MSVKRMTSSNSLRRLRRRERAVETGWSMNGSNRSNCPCVMFHCLARYTVCVKGSFEHGSFQPVRATVNLGRLEHGLESPCHVKRFPSIHNAEGISELVRMLSK